MHRMADSDAFTVELQAPEIVICLSAVTDSTRLSLIHHYAQIN